MSNSLRLCQVALVAMLAILAAASATCSSSGNANTFDPKTSNCSAVTTCLASLCTCAGGTVSTAGKCNNANTTCDAGTTCVRTYIQCVQGSVAAANTSTEAACRAWGTSVNTIQLTLTGATGGTVYKASTLYTDCQSFSCNVLNSTTYDWTSCDVDYRRLCVSPVAATLRLTLKGNWAAILNNETAKKLIKKALEDDLSAAFGAPVYVESLSIATSRRAAGDLIVVFVVSIDKTAAASVVNGGALSLPSTQGQFSAAGGSGFGVTTPTIDGVTPAPTTGASSVAAIVSVLAAVVAALLAF